MPSKIPNLLFPPQNRRQFFKVKCWPANGFPRSSSLSHLRAPHNVIPGITLDRAAVSESLRRPRNASSRRMFRSILHFWLEWLPFASVHFGEARIHSECFLLARYDGMSVGAEFQFLFYFSEITLSFGLAPFPNTFYSVIFQTLSS